MYNESPFEKIIRKTGRKPVSCKCELCKNQCRSNPCLGTPQDIEKIIDAGYADRIFLTDWAAGIMMGVTNEVIEMYQPEYDDNKKSCTFFNNGLCDLHDKGLKPTEGKLSHHSHKADNFNPKKSLAWNVAKTWIAPENSETIKRIYEKKNT